MYMFRLTSVDSDQWPLVGSEGLCGTEELLFDGSWSDDWEAEETNVTYPFEMVSLLSYLCH